MYARSIIIVICVVHVLFSDLYAATLYSSITTPNANVFTYPSISRHDNRYWDNRRFLFEHPHTQEGIDPELGSLSCVQDAVDTLSQSMPYYAYYYGRDTKIITNMADVPANIGVVVFSHALSQEAALLPSAQGYADLRTKHNLGFLSGEGNGDLSPMLYLSSLLKIMCPLIRSHTGYPWQRSHASYDYVMFEYMP